ncbi:MAG TPA: hypothetical protein VD788_11835, partial [Candidatus Polarisedimenticolaceae bacterium]|nr:hypothetical protein [Candidatus Polarisedimenticolaceae bacterium]
MEIGEAIARASVWFALCCYPAGPFGPVVSTARGKRVARFVWTAGCVAFAAHVVASFGAFYEWSHLVALDETRRRSAAVTGIDSGLGLYLNYLFGLLWMLDAAWWWSDDEAYGRRSRRGLLLFHAFF